MHLGKLYLIPTPLGDGALHTLPSYVIEIVHTLQTFVVERSKTARLFFKQIQHPSPQADLELAELNEHTPHTELLNLLQPVLDGKDMGLLSEAGCPAVADPGANLVRLAHQYGVEVVPCVGASSILLAAMASGMYGQSFAFLGYLPVQSAERKKALQRLEKLSNQQKQTQLCIEAPYRNTAFLQDAIACLLPHTLFGIATDLTLPTQYIRTQTIAQWKKTTLPDLNKRPTIFSLLSE